MSAPHPPPDGVLFDAGATLVQPSIERLEDQLEALGCTVDASLDDALWRAMALFDHDFGPHAGDPADWVPQWLVRLGEEAGVPGDAMTRAWRAADDEVHLWDQPVAGARACLRRLRDAGVRVGVVSNSDGRVADALERAGLSGHLEVIVDSAVVGVAKPHPEIFDHALQPMGLTPDRTWYLGDTVGYDVAAADAAGLVSWVIDHRGLHTREHPRRVRSLDEFADRVLEARGQAPRAATAHRAAPDRATPDRATPDRATPDRATPGGAASTSDASHVRSVPRDASS